jgi:DNA-binding NarL/FixJ family response regulator
MSRVALLGLPDDLGNELSRVLLDESHQVSRKIYISDLQRTPKCNAVFISGDDPDYRYTLSLLRESCPGLPAIVVTRQPEARFWLDALDAGAADYCGAPFERAQLRWVLESVLAGAERRPAEPEPALPA